MHDYCSLTTFASQDCLISSQKVGSNTLTNHMELAMHISGILSHMNVTALGCVKKHFRFVLFGFEKEEYEYSRRVESTQ